MMSCKVIFTNESIRTTIESNRVDWSRSEVCFRICSFVRLVWINKLTMSRIEKARWSFVSISSVQFISLGWSLCEHLFIHSFIHWLCVVVHGIISRVILIHSNRMCIWGKWNSSSIPSWLSEFCFIGNINFSPHSFNVVCWLELAQSPYTLCLYVCVCKISIILWPK